MPVPPLYGIHDTYVRDGLAFVFAWNTGVIIYDVGNGIRSGSPAAPVEVSRILTAASGVKGGSAVHNGWWFHNPVSGEQRYLFVGQEGAGIIGAASSGDIHVVDVSDLANPTEVAETAGNWGTSRAVLTFGSVTRAGAGAGRSISATGVAAVLCFGVGVELQPPDENGESGAAAGGAAGADVV